MSKRASASTSKSTEPRVYRKPKADIYTVLLSIALIALILGSIALWAVMGDYNKLIKGGPNPVWNHPAAPAIFDAPSGLA